MVDLLRCQSSSSSYDSDLDSNLESYSDHEIRNPFSPIFRNSNYPESDTDSQPDISSLATDLFSSNRDSTSQIFATELNGVSICNDDRDGDGLRVVGVDSDSGSDTGGVLELGYGGDNDDDDGNSEFGDGIGVDEDQVFWDSFFRVDNDDRRDGDGSRDGAGEGRNGRLLGDLVEEVLAMTGVPEEEFADSEIRRIEMEVLLAFNVLERSMVMENEGFDFNQEVVAHYGAAEYETLLEHLMESDVIFRGRPPAAKSVVESLPLVELGKEGLSDGSVVCAVCKEEVVSDEMVRKLPCCHYYHDECIGPWLEIRNTCPVCRYELPTDDPEYELRKNLVPGHGRGLVEDAEVRYGL